MAYTIPPGDTDIVGTLTRILADIDVRLKRAQEATDTLPAAEREFRANALRRISADLAPMVDTLRARIQRGVLTATSDSEVLLVGGVERTWVIAEADRTTFAPSPYVLALRRLSLADTALLRVTGWDPASGAFTAEVLEITGNPGPHADWEFVSGPGVVTAQRTWLAEGRAARAAIEALEVLVKGYRDAAAGSATASGLDRQQTGLDKLATGNDRTEVLRLRNETVAAAGTVDTANFLQLDGLRQLTGKLRLVASAAGRAAFNVPAGTDPSAPAEGDGWNAGGTLKAFLGGVTRVFAFLGLAQTWTARQTFTVPINLAPGGTSAAPADGDLRITGAGVFARYGGVEAQLADATVVAAAIGGKADKATTPSLDDLRTLAIQFAKLKGSTVGMAAGVADDFKDASGYDAASSTNAVYDQTNNIISNPVGGVEELAPMTSNTTPSGQTASATTEYSTSFRAFQAYDGASNTEWISTTQGTQSIQRTTSAARREASYAITPRNGYPTQGPGNFTRWGSNDGGATRTTLDFQNGITWTNGQRRVFTIPSGNRGNYTTYGLTITAGAGANDVYAMSALESLPESAGALELRSVAFAAAAVPAKGSMFALVKATSGAITPNTNLLADISRDGGATWTTGTLVAAGSYGGYTMYEANGFDISGQPSGTSMKWRLRTVGSTLFVAVDAVVAQWG